MDQASKATVDSIRATIAAQREGSAKKKGGIVTHQAGTIPNWIPLFEDLLSLVEQQSDAIQELRSQIASSPGRG